MIINPYGFPAPSGGVSPDLVTGLQLWLDGDNAPSGTVNTWPDESGQGRDGLAAASGGTRVSAPNGHFAIGFNGTTDSYVISSGPALDDFDWLFVVNQTGDNILAGGNSGASPQLRVGQSGGNVLSTYDGAGVGQSNNPLSSTLGIAQGNWNLLRFTRSGSTVTFRQNGINYGTGAMVGTQFFGKIGEVVSVLYLNGSLATALAYDNALATSDGEGVEDWLGARYALTITH